MRPTVRLRAALAAIALVSALPFIRGASADLPGPAPITFSHGRVVDIQRLGGEPELKSDSDGNLYVTAPIGVQYIHSFLWKSEDDGESFDLLRAFPPMQRPMPSLGSGDATTAILPARPGAADDTIVWSDMVNLAGLANAASFDGGNTFPAEYWNLFATDPGADRQWLTGIRLPGTTTDRVYQVYNQATGGGLSVIYTDDYGQSWTVGQRGIDGFSSVGNIAADPVRGKVYIGYASGSQAKVAAAGLDASGFVPSVAGSGSGSVANLFTSVDVDSAGNVYTAWIESGGARAVYMASSTDGGATWSPRRQVSPPNLKSNVFPWIVAGDPGRAWVVWYGTATNAAPPANRGPWDLYGAQTLNALGASPTFETVKISEHPMHDNEICLSGIACTVGQGEDRNLLDDFTADIDPQGMLHVSYNDTNNQLTTSPDPDASGAFIVHAKQQSGPSLLSSVGEVVPAPTAPQVGNVAVAGTTLTATGTHSLPAGNWGSDRGGDGRFPRHGAGGPGPNDPALDVRSVWLTNQAEGLRMDVELGALPTVLTAGGRTVVYLIFYWLEGRVHFAAVEAQNGVFTHAYGGLPTPVPNQAGIAKFALYQPNNNTRPLTLTPTTKGFAVRFDTPIQDGKRLDQVTAFSFIPAAGAGIEALMDEIDATPATSWRAGDPRLPAGHVELSVDNPSFAAPVVAGLTDYPGPGWAGTVDVAGLGVGEHVLYVRQVANGFPGAATAVPFSIGL